MLKTVGDVWSYSADPGKHAKKLSAMFGATVWSRENMLKTVGDVWSYSAEPGKLAKKLLAMFGATVRIRENLLKTVGDVRDDSAKQEKFVRRCQFIRGRQFLKEKCIKNCQRIAK